MVGLRMERTSAQSSSSVKSQASSEIALNLCSGRRSTGVEVGVVVDISIGPACRPVKARTGGPDPATSKLSGKRS
jgi:hypothetical protein